MKKTITSQLAISSGTPVRSGPYPPWPHYPNEQIEEVAVVLRSGAVNYWTGHECREFEREFAKMCEVNYAVAVSNGTIALELALEALDIGPGDEVVVTPRTFLASASAIVRNGAKPVFADVHPDNQNISADTIRRVLTEKTKAILPVHLAGWPCDMDDICTLADEHDLRIIEDCAQAVGAEFDGCQVGSFGDIGAHSFCQDKIMTTGGEGGMLVTQSEALWSRLWSLKDHGKNYATVYPAKPPPENHGFRWLHESFGTNGRMTEMQAAIGRAQLKILPEWLAVRRRHADQLTGCFKDIRGLRVTVPSERHLHAYYKYYAFVRPEHLKAEWDRDKIRAAIKAEGVPCYSGSCSEIYREKAFNGTDFRPAESLPIAKELGETSLMFLVHPTLSDTDIEHTCEAVEKVFAVAMKD